MQHCGARCARAGIGARCGGRQLRQRAAATPNEVCTCSPRARCLYPAGRALRSGRPLVAACCACRHPRPWPLPALLLLQVKETDSFHVARVAKQDDETEEDILVLLPVVEGAGVGQRRHMRSLGYLGSFLLAYTSAQVGPRGRARPAGKGAAFAGQLGRNTSSPQAPLRLDRLYTQACMPGATHAEASGLSRIDVGLLSGCSSPTTAPGTCRHCVTSCTRAPCRQAPACAWSLPLIRAESPEPAAAHCAADPCACCQVRSVRCTAALWCR